MGTMGAYEGCPELSKLKRDNGPRLSKIEHILYSMTCFSWAGFSVREHRYNCRKNSTADTATNRTRQLYCPLCPAMRAARKQQAVKPSSMSTELLFMTFLSG